MDPLTHLLIAYCLVFWIKWFRKLPIKFLIPYLIGSVIPDLDYIFNGLAYFAPKLFWLEHRTMGHSLFGVIPFVLVTGAIFNISNIRIFFWSEEKYSELKFWSWFGLLSIYLGSLAHILADFFVPTGVMLFFPISFKWYGIKLLSTNNIQTIFAVIFAVSIWPLKWNKQRRKIALSLFIIVFTFYSSVRLAVNLRSNNLFQEKYGPGLYSSNEYIFTYNINYNIYNSTDLQNNTYIITTIDGIKQEFISEEFIPEIKIFANKTDYTLAISLLNKTKESGHYYRLLQKNQLVCARINQETNSTWIITWFAPIRETETRLENNFINIGSSTRAIFHIQNDGVITRIIRPFSV